MLVRANQGGSLHSWHKHDRFRWFCGILFPATALPDVDTRFLLSEKRWIPVDAPLSSSVLYRSFALKGVHTSNEQSHCPVSRLQTEYTEEALKREASRKHS